MNYHAFDDQFDEVFGKDDREEHKVYEMDRAGRRPSASPVTQGQEAAGLEHE